MKGFWGRVLMLMPWRRRAAEREMQEELRSLADLAGSRELGNLVQVAEDARAQWGWPWLEDIGKDVRYGLRGLRRNPGFTATVVISLAIGIGASTTLFTLVNAVQGRRLPVANPDRLVALSQQHGTALDSGFTYQQFQRLTEQLTDVALAGYSRQPFAIGIDGTAELPVDGELVSGNYFSILGIRPARGRLLQPEDDRAGAGNPVAVLSDAYWKERFAGDPAAVGRVLNISGQPFTVVGVTPPGFFGIEVGTAPQVFVPLTMQPVVVSEREDLIQAPHLFLTWVRVIGAQRPSASPAQVRTQLAAVLQAPDWQPPDKFTGRVEPTSGVVTSIPNGRSDIGSRFSTTFVILTFVVGVVLLIACANTANLALARAAVRRPEFALRVALGAGRARIIRQVTVESLLLAAAAGGAGVALSYWATRALVHLASAGQTAISLDLNPDWRVLIFATLVSGFVGLAFGLVPAIRVSRNGTEGSSVRDIGNTRYQTGAAGPARTFLIVQVALSVTLLVGATVFVASLRNLIRQADGIPARDAVLTVRVAPRGSDQRNTPGTSQRLDQAYQTLLEQVRRVPGVRTASMANTSPLTPTALSQRVSLGDGTVATVPTLMVYPQYFATLGLTMTAGRDFDERDTVSTSSAAAIVNAAYVRQILGGKDPIASGAVIQAPRLAKATLTPIPIVGVVSDSPYPNLREPSAPIIYQTFLQTRTGRGQMVLHVRADGEPSTVAERIRTIVQNIDPYTPSFPVASLADELDATLIRERLMAIFGAAFAAVVAVLIAVGLYGLTAFSVSRRTSEIGLRVAMGATDWDVCQLVVGHTARVVLIGLGIGGLVAWTTMRIAADQLAGLLFDVRPNAPLAFVAAVTALVAIALMASFVPARRATRIDPVSALRGE